jgi:hypothetical protein
MEHFSKANWSSLNKLLLSTNSAMQTTIILEIKGANIYLG